MFLFSYMASLSEEFTGILRPKKFDLPYIIFFPTVQLTVTMTLSKYKRTQYYYFIRDFTSFTDYIKGKRREHLGF